MREQQGWFPVCVELEKMKTAAGLADFGASARRLIISVQRSDKLLAPLLARQENMEALIQRSFLSVPAKGAYLLQYQIKRNQLNTR